MSRSDARREPDRAVPDPAPVAYAPERHPTTGGLAGPAAASSPASDIGEALRPAPFVKRLLAGIVDVIALMTFAFAAQLVAGRVFVGDSLPEKWTSLVATGAAWDAAVCLYASCEVWGRASPAKSLMGLRVAAVGGGRARVGPKLVRAVIKQMPLVVLAVVTGLLIASLGGASDLSRQAAEHLITILPYSFLGTCGLSLGGCLLALLPSRRAAHDLVSGTAVYEVADLARVGTRDWAVPRAFDVQVIAGRDEAESTSAT